MTNTDPKTHLAQGNLPENIQDQIDSALAGGLGELTIRELLSMSLGGVARAERENYLRLNPQDKANGSYSRSLTLGSLKIPFEVPRCRTSEFRPTMLPAHYQRGYDQSTQELLLALLCSSRSINAAKSALRNLGVPVGEDALEQIATEFIEDFRLKNSAPLSSDLLALFVDGKYVEIRDGDQLRPATIYVAVGLLRDGTKRILSCMVRSGRENLDDWKKLLRGLLERGLRRVLILVQDDFSGLLKVSQGLFPNTDVQLCIVHMQRNAKSHFSKSDAATFLARIRAIKASFSSQRAAADFDDLCAEFKDKSPAFIKALLAKRDFYLRFIDYPDRFRTSLSTTNAVEAVNGQLERLRRNNGGYFHGEDNLDMKLGIAITYLENGKWRKPAGGTIAVLDQLNAMFEHRFEACD